MKFFNYVLIIILLFSVLEPISAISEKKEIEISEKQKWLAEWLESQSGPLKAEWINLYTIEVTYHPGHIEVMTENEIQETAHNIAELGFAISKKSTCAKITNVQGEELAYKCTDKISSVPSLKYVDPREDATKMAKIKNEFAEQMKEFRGTTQVNWLSSHKLEVRYNQEAIELMTQSNKYLEKDGIKDRAETIALMGAAETLEYLCVSVTDEKGNELAYACHH